MLQKVIHTIETAEPGGAETILVQVADGLREEFEPVGVVLEEGWTSAALAESEIPCIHLPLTRSFDLTWVRRMVRFIRENDIRLVHSHEFTTNAYSLVAAKIAGIPVLCTVHGKNYYPERYYRRLATRLTARHADMFVAVSRDLADFLVSRIGIPRDRIHVVYNGIDTRRFDRSSYNTMELRKGFGIDGDAYVIIVVAALFEGKGHRDLVTALGETGLVNDRITVLFVGDGPCRQALQQQSAEMGVEDIVRFTGFRSDIAELLAISDLFILPSYSEGLPVSVLEAMSTGVPVIATDVGGLKEIVRDGANAHLIPPARPDELASKIRYCLENRAHAATLVAHAREDVESRFGLGTMLDNYRSLYYGLLTG